MSTVIEKEYSSYNIRLPLMASGAAIELERVLSGQDYERTRAEGLLDFLSNNVFERPAGGTARLVDAGNVLLVSQVLNGTFRTVSQRLDDFYGELDDMVSNLKKFVAEEPLDDNILKELRDFCSGLARCASSKSSSFTAHRTSESSRGF